MSLDQIKDRFQKIRSAKAASNQSATEENSQEISKITNDKPLSGTELRNRSWGMIHAARLDYSPKYIRSVFNGRVQPVDGVIRTPRGYYRLAEDMRDGTQILLHSYERAQITGVIDESGNFVLAEDADDIYGISARRDTQGHVFRDDMNFDIRFLEKSFQRDLNLHAEEILIPSNTKDGEPKRKIKLANSAIAIGIMETDEGKWNVRIYKNLRKNWDDKDRFVQVSAEPENGYQATLTTQGTSIREFETLKDAIHYARRYWKNESYRMFKGRELLIDTDSKKKWYQGFRERALSAALYITDHKIHRDWSRAIAVSVGVGVISAMVGAAFSGTPLVGAFVGVGAGLWWATFGKSVETTVANVQSKIMSPYDEARERALRPIYEQNLIADYLDPSETNQRRIRRKLDEETRKNIRLLNLEEADMIYDDVEPSSPDNEWRDFERLSSAAYRYFGSQFDSSNAEHDILVSSFPNGMIKLTQVDQKTRATRHYVTYNKEFDLFDSEDKYKHLDPNLSQLPVDAQIHKITHRQGKDFRYVPLSCDEFMADLGHKIDDAEAVRDMKAFGLPLKDLFNCNACDGIMPRAKDAIPVEDWLEKRRKGQADFIPMRPG